MKRTLPAPRIFVAALAFALPCALLAQKAVFVVRHAEKASDANDASVPLSAAGTARAERLAALLKNSGVSAIYSTDTVRTRKTAEPLAAEKKLDVRIYNPTGPDGKVSLTALAEKLKRENASDVVLVVGHSNRSPSPGTTTTTSSSSSLKALARPLSCACAIDVRATP